MEKLIIEICGDSKEKEYHCTLMANDPNKGIYNIHSASAKGVFNFSLWLDAKQNYILQIYNKENGSKFFDINSGYKNNHGHAHFLLNVSKLWDTK